MSEDKKHPLVEAAERDKEARAGYPYLQKLPTHNQPLDRVDELLERMTRPKVYCQPNDYVFTLIASCREDIEDALKCPDIASDCLNAALGRLSSLASILKGER